MPSIRLLVTRLITRIGRLFRNFFHRSLKAFSGTRAPLPAAVDLHEVLGLLFVSSFENSKILDNRNFEESRIIYAMEGALSLEMIAKWGT